MVVFDNDGESDLPEPNSDGNESGAAFLIRILRYLETPQYLRKALFPKHNSLRFVVRFPKYCAFMLSTSAVSIFVVVYEF